MELLWKIVGIPIAGLSMFAGGILPILALLAWETFQKQPVPFESLVPIVALAATALALNAFYLWVRHLFRGNGNWCGLGRQAWRILMTASHGVGFLGMAAMVIFAGPN